MGSDVSPRLRAYFQDRAARLRACQGGHVTKFVGRRLWYCDGCGEEFTDEGQATAPQHESKDADAE